MNIINFSLLRLASVFLFLILGNCLIICENSVAASINEPKWTEGPDGVMFLMSGDYPTVQDISVKTLYSASHAPWWHIDFSGSVDLYIKEKACCLLDNLSGARSVYSKDADVNLIISVACNKNFPVWNDRIYRPSKQAQEIAEWDAWMSRLDVHETYHYLSFVAFMKQANLDAFLHAQDFSKGSDSYCAPTGQVEVAKDVVTRQLQAELVDFRAAIKEGHIANMRSDHTIIGERTPSLPVID